MDLNSGKDLFLVLAAGGGRTFILQAPLQAAKARREKGIGLMAAPTKVLVEQQAFIAFKYGFRAIVIHEDMVRVARSRGQDLFKQLAAGSDVRLAVMSPQMLRSKPMMKLIKTATFDEAHFVNERTGTFRLPYRSIPTMRALLSSQTTWAAVTGTATPERVLAMAKAALGFQPGRYINATINFQTLLQWERLSSQTLQREAGQQDYGHSHYQQQQRYTSTQEHRRTPMPRPVTLLTAHRGIVDSLKCRRVLI